ncbi:Hypothetical protein GbCGDNIH2_7302 [Granulibacter bethesdensis]|nr:Hypothetical protein GbCGDNIH2_7302 [Granulibacter bethesdensis]
MELQTFVAFAGLSFCLVEGLARGVFGSPAWMAAALGRSGGSSRSAAKVTAAREKGKKGGRPRKVGS